ncbi:hypothetical protein AACH06_29155 [Ideonella sp. DXS29W]|uniref:Uncharacterized protein n=1 Tax=Ideonella lacteola TaxID=2984193 RepID=A0ABU9C2J7_9BURK
MPSNAVAFSALVFACVVPGAVSAIAFLNPLFGLWVAGLSLLHGFTLGAPAFLALRRFGWVNLPTSLGFGLVIGGLPAAIVFSGIPGQFLPFAGFGLVSGGLFWASVWWQSRRSSLLVASE